MKKITPQHPEDITDFVKNFNVHLMEYNFPYYLRLGAALVSSEKEIDYEVDLLRHDDPKFFRIMWYSDKNDLSTFSLKLDNILKDLR